MGRNYKSRGHGPGDQDGLRKPGNLEEKKHSPRVLKSEIELRTDSGLPGFLVSVASFLPKFDSRFWLRLRRAGLSVVKTFLSHDRGCRTILEASQDQDGNQMNVMHPLARIHINLDKMAKRAAFHSPQQEQSSGTKTFIVAE